MASLSEEMKNKRDVRRRASVLIIDKDLGNYGLYKSILAMEYELECINSTATALTICNGRAFDVIVVDGGFEVAEVEAFFNAIMEKCKEEKPICLVLEESANKESIVNYLSIGAKDYIAKPFTKEGITNVIHNQLKKRRENKIRQEVLIIDEDFENLKQLKGYLEHKYKVDIINSREIANKYIARYKPNLVICDIGMFADNFEDVCNVKMDIPIMFMTNTPDAQTISRCAKLNPEGFLIKPIQKDMLIKTLDRIFLKESYTHFGR